MIAASPEQSLLDMPVLGFDPGGDKGFGCCVLRAAMFETGTVSSIDAAMRWAITACGDEVPPSAGIDTLLHWSDGPSGWRRADRMLLNAYPEAKASVLAPNSLRGAMALGGIGLAIRLRELWPSIALTETHPKVLFHALRGARYLKAEVAAAVRWFIEDHVLTAGETRNEHEFDALISAWVAREGRLRQWTDLCEPKTPDMIFPAGPVSYLWPAIVTPTGTEAT